MERRFASHLRTGLNSALSDDVSCCIVPGLVMRGRGSMRRRRVLLHLLLLLHMPLLHLLGLLLVALFHLLLVLCVGLPFLRLLMLFILLLLEFLPFLHLLLVHLFLLLLVLLLFLGGVRIGVAGTLVRGQIIRVNRAWVAASAGLRPLSPIRRWGVPPALPRGHDILPSKFRSPRARRDRRLALIHRSAQFAVLPRRVNVLCLGGRHSDVPFPCRGFFLGICVGIHTAIAPVVTDTRHVHVAIFDVGVIDIVNDRDIHVVHRAVVEKMPMVPSPAFIPVTEVSESVNDPAVESHRCPPVAWIPQVAAPSPTPISRRPQKSHLRRHDPRARHPVVVAIPSPVSRHPDVILCGADGLFVDWQFRRCERNRHSNLRT